MPETVKVLGQTKPIAGSYVDLYTVPAGSQAVVSSLLVTNCGGSIVVYRLAVRPGGSPLSDQHHFVYDLSLPANGMEAYTLGLTLGSGDVVTVYNRDNADVVFQAYGTELTP